MVKPSKSFPQKTKELRPSLFFLSGWIYCTKRREREKERCLSAANKAARKARGELKFRQTGVKSHVCLI